jgi:glycosyltransferase involved in cell wall biosynthesis
MLYGVEAILLPNGVDVASTQGGSGVAAEILRARHRLTVETVLFMGSYAYRPNGEAIDFLVTDVFPELTRRRPGARLLITGGAVPYERPWLIAPGLVPAEDLPGLIKACAVSVAPIFSGSGTRLKILESLAAGTPVIATAKGAEGLPLKPGGDFIQAETAADFVNALAQVLHDPEQSRRAYTRAFEEVRRSFDWRALTTGFCRYGIDRRENRWAAFLGLNQETPRRRTAPLRGPAGTVDRSHPTGR